MDYDKRRKHYYANDKFYPIFISPSAEDYLAGLLAPVGQGGGHLFGGASGFRPPIDAVPMPERRADNFILRALLKAIREKLALEIHYQSLSSQYPEWRWIEPHALASDGQRWHVRAYCWNRQTFRDFVIGRITASRDERPAAIAMEMDVDWREWVRIVLAPAPGLPNNQRKIIEYDFGMKDGMTELIVRRALAYYVQQRYGEERQAGSPQARQVVIIGVTPAEEPA
ncbi:MAG: helix-turn-helix transcriptional regulator [Actinomycetota bacterium]